MWSVVDRRPAAMLPGLVLLVACLTAGCAESGDELGAVPAVARATGAEVRKTTDPEAEASSADRIRRGGDGPASILEFGLFGPVVPTLESEGYYQTDCRFENDPYETCL